MRVAVFSARPYDEQFLAGANAGAGHELTYLETRLSRETGRLAAGFDAVCVFVNNELDADLLGALQADGLKLVALRAAGFNNVDVVAAQRCGVTVARVPAYSPRRGWLDRQRRREEQYREAGLGPMHPGELLRKVVIPSLKATGELSRLPQRVRLSREVQDELLAETRTIDAYIADGLLGTNWARENPPALAGK